MIALYLSCPAKKNVKAKVNDLGSILVLVKPLIITAGRLVICISEMYNNNTA